MSRMTRMVSNVITLRFQSACGIRLGHVLVELSGVGTMLEWMGGRVSPTELWKMWLSSPTVRAFETGQIQPDAFASQLIDEMSLPVSAGELLKQFARWNLGPFPGAIEMVASIPRSYTRATLCNSNAVHWPQLMSQKELIGAFDHHFVSHLTGKIKPDSDAFHQVIDSLNCRASEILFLDDNSLNTDAASRIGIASFQVRGVAEAIEVLTRSGILAANGH